MVRPFGTARITSGVTARVVVALCTSTTGASPVTVIVSSSTPTRISAFTDAVKFASISIPSRRVVVKPGSVKVTL